MSTPHESSHTPQYPAQAGEDVVATGVNAIPIGGRNYSASDLREQPRAKRARHESPLPELKQGGRKDQLEAYDQHKSREIRERERQDLEDMARDEAIRQINNTKTVTPLKRIEDNTLVLHERNTRDRDTMLFAPNLDATNFYVTDKAGPGVTSVVIDGTPKSILGLAALLEEKIKRDPSILEFKIGWTEIEHQHHEEQKQRVYSHPNMERIICVNCSLTHSLRDCPKPHAEHGCILGCPNCNTLDYIFDDCHITKSWFVPGTREFTTRGVREMALLIEARANKPWYGTERICFLSILVLFYREANTRHYATKGMLPWTNDFSKIMANTRIGDDALQGKLHWSSWHSRLHDWEELPTDTIYLDEHGDRLPLEAIYAKRESRFIPRQTLKPNAAPARVPVKSENPERS
ncbi:hypothetical protein V8F33_008599 [Rhypophila sp. PSN 637]